MIGVVGGMGIRATWRFCEHLTNAIDAPKEWDYPKFIVHTAPQIPSRTRSLLFGETDPGPYIAEALGEIEADIIAVPCNSVYWWYDKVKDYRWINMVEVVSSRIDLAASTLVIGGYATMKYALYGDQVTYPLDEYDRIARVLEDLRTGRGINDYRLFADLCYRYKPKKILLACTEFSLMKIHPRWSFLDSSKIYAEEVAKIWRRQYSCSQERQPDSEA
jgi:aspartate racemase